MVKLKQWKHPILYTTLPIEVRLGGQVFTLHTCRIKVKCEDLTPSDTEFEGVATEKRGSRALNIKCVSYLFSMGNVKCLLKKTKEFRKMKEKLITVYRHNLLQHVEIVKSLLEHNGINCLMKGVDKMEPDVMYATGIELQVHNIDRDKATKLIKEASF